MSARKGDSTKRGQRHQNSSAYKAHLHGCPKRKQEALSVPLSGVCGRCKDKVEWRKKYDKYKPLTVPRKCTICEQKKVRQAYHQICQECAEERGVCAKCGKQEETIQQFPLSMEEQLKKEAHFHDIDRRLSERGQCVKHAPGRGIPLQAREESMETATELLSESSSDIGES